MRALQRRRAEHAGVREAGSLLPGPPLRRGCGRRHGRHGAVRREGPDHPRGVRRDDGVGQDGVVPGTARGSGD